MPTLNLNDPIQLCILIALAAQIPVAAVAMLTVFSQRKKVPTPARREAVQAARGISHPAPITAERAGAAPERHALAPEVAAPPQPEIAPSIEPEAPPPVEVQAPRALEQPPEIEIPAESIAEVEPEVPSVPEVPARAPIRIGLGLRKTRENFLARIRAAITGSAKADEIYEGLEEALIGADVGVEGSLKLVVCLVERLFL